MKEGWNENNENQKFTISKDEINELPLYTFDGKIHLIETRQEAEEAAEVLDGASLLGFDTETKPSFVRGEHHPIALIQLATEDEAWLFRVNHTGMTRGLREILENGSITKVVQAARQESDQLNRDFEVDPEGLVDLLPIAKAAGCHPLSIRALAAILLGIRVSKSARVTNWARKRLSEKQIRYAATDAWVSLRIYLKMLELGLAS